MTEKFFIVRPLHILAEGCATRIAEEWTASRMTKAELIAYATAEIEVSLESQRVAWQEVCRTHVTWIKEEYGRLLKPEDFPTAAVLQRALERELEHAELELIKNPTTEALAIRDALQVQIQMLAAAPPKR